MRAEFIKDIESVDMDRPFRRLRKERRMSLIFARGLGFLLRMVVWCRVFSVLQEQSQLRSGARGLDESVVSENVYEDLPCQALDDIYYAGRLQ